MSQLTILKGSPVPPPVDLREDQKLLKKEIYDCVRQGYRRIQVVAPCGFGKSRLGAALIRDILYKEKKALFLVHAKCLVEQTIEEFAKHKIFAGAICSGMKEYRRYNVQVAMVQTLERRKDKLWFEPDIVIADEVHELGFRDWFVRMYPRLKEDGTPVSTVQGLAPELQTIGFDVDAMVEGREPWPSMEDCRATYRKSAFENHPDQGGSKEAMQIINGAWDEIRKHKHLFDGKKCHDDSTAPLLIGLTATPWRLSKRQSMGDIFPVQVVGPTPGDMVKRGKETNFQQGLVPFVYWGIPGADTKEIRIIRGEFDQSQLDEVFSVPEVIQCAIENYKSKASGRRFICFPTTIHHAKLLVHAFVKAGIPCALISGDTPNKARKIIFQEVKDKKLLGIVSVGCVGIGFDLPEVSCIIDCAPTMSKAKFVQGAGRGQRIAPWDGKTDCIYLDQAGNVERFGFIESIEYGGLHQGNRNPTSGEALIKECPSCGHLLLISLMKCVSCGYEFPVTYKEPSVGEMRLLLSEQDQILFDAFRSLLKTAFVNRHKPDWAIHQLNKLYRKHPTVAEKQAKKIPGKKGMFWPLKAWYYHAIFEENSVENKSLYLSYLKDVTKNEVKLEWWYEYQLSREFGDNWKEGFQV